MILFEIVALVRHRIGIFMLVSQLCLMHITPIWSRRGHLTWQCSRIYWDQCTFLSRYPFLHEAILQAPADNIVGT